MKGERPIEKVTFSDMEGKNRRERPRKEWLDDIQEWYKMDIYRLYKASSKNITT